ncbi:lanthionine synthetase LanC family protein [Anditalea andensis]|uniref:Lanthionine synthetase C-like protein n=1 Tax=Anditalea andensis TaxID=1048983 RepID=A0A074LPR9_9BACT|nr:lanthionine synthetase LanC family protein [Anditalea andensis]KEO75942.1 hypothetical protein EL17_00065 [Anditalea andensis]
MINLFQNQLSAEQESSNRALGDIVEKIAQSLNKNAHMLENFTVEDGWLGACLFYCYYAKYTGDDRHFDKVVAYLDKALPLIDYQCFKAHYPNDGYDFNLSGLGMFLIKAVDNGFLDMDICPYLEKIDDVLYDQCRDKINHGDFNLSSGALAMGHYLLSNGCRSAKNESLLIEIIEGIEKQAIKSREGGIYWMSTYIKDRVYTGLRHGSVMVISFLSAAFDKGILKDKCLSLIKQGMDFLISCRRNGSNNLFPIYLEDFEQKNEFGLCELEIGYGLLRGAITLKDASMVAVAKEVLMTCTERCFKDQQNMDASIRHGASGLAYLYERISRMDPTEDKYLQAYDYWIRQLPKYATAQKEFCGFESHLQRASNSYKLSFSGGIIGIGITLMKHLKKDLPRLDGFINTY